MMTQRTFTAAAALSLATGLAWWASVTPRALPLLPLLIGHLFAGLGLLGALWLLRLRGFMPWAAGWILSAVLVPTALTPFHLAGLLGGKEGAAVDVIVLTGAALLGAGLAHLQRSRPRLGVMGLAAASIGALAAMGWAHARIPEETQPTAKAVVERFSPQPVAVLGIDGGDWQVIDPLLAAGELPTLAGLIARGQRGVLRSMDPMASPVIWTSIFTGDRPSTHGLEDWLRSDARSRRVPTLWDIYDAHGQPSLTVNVPGSWPPPQALERGALLSGFPIPGLAGGDTGHLLGQLVSTAPSSGRLPTIPTTRDGDAFAATLTIAGPELRPTIPNAEHVLLKLLVRESLLSVDGDTLRLRVTPTSRGARIEGDFEGPALELERGAWSPWLAVVRPSSSAWVRLHLLTAEADGVTLFVSPAFQDPLSPRHRFALGVDDPALLIDDGAPYVVEGLGWTAHRDARVAHLVPDLIFDVQDTQLRVAEALLARETPTLLSFVYTATDRIQHPFWSLHEPEPYGGWSPPEAVRGEDYVIEAYRRADEALGRLLSKMPEDTLVFVVSDHGADPHDGRMEEGEAGHRAEGIWIAAGPLIPHREAGPELSVIDVVPTLLRCVGAPVAEDFDGEVVREVCPGAGDAARVASYLGQPGATREDGLHVDEQQLKQIQSLGYIEPDE